MSPPAGGPQWETPEPDDNGWVWTEPARERAEPTWAGHYATPPGTAWSEPAPPVTAWSEPAESETGWPDPQPPASWPPAPAPGREAAPGWPEDIRWPGNGRAARDAHGGRDGDPGWDGHAGRDGRAARDGHTGRDGRAPRGATDTRPRPTPRRPDPRRKDRQRSGGGWRAYLLGTTLVALVMAGIGVGVLRTGWLDGKPTPWTVPPVTTTGVPQTPRATGSAGPTPTGSAAPVEKGVGTFTAVETGGQILGTAGTLRRFRVEVENGLNENPDEFAKVVDTVLGDQRSWIASGQFRLQRVPRGAPAEFTVYLASPVTSEAMCAAGGLHTDKFTSCRLTGQVIINDARWLTAVPDYNAPLDVYRAYAINHEVGHELGHGHEACTGAGRPAPVMQQQTLGLKGCVANPWPFISGDRYAGPAIP